MFGSRAKELEGRLVTLKMELEKISDAKTAAENDLKKAREDKSALKLELMDVQNAKDALETKFKDTKAAMEAKFQDTTNELKADFANQKANLEKKFGEEKADLEKQFNEKKASLETKLSEVETSLHKQVESLKGEKAALGQELEQTKDAMSKELQQAKDALGQEVENLRGEKAALGQELEQTKDAMSKELQQTKDALGQELEALKGEKAALSQEFQQAKDALDQEVASLKDKKAALELDLEKSATATAYLQQELTEALNAKSSLDTELGAAKDRLAQLEAIVGDADLVELQEKARETLAQSQGLREMYQEKLRGFEQVKEEEEQKFAKEAASRRYGLENEIRENRQASEDYVARAVGEFNETYNYYFNQIRILMDALSNVARDAGQNLFHGESGNLKTNFALQLANELKSGRTALESDREKLIVIGASEEDTELLENAGSDAAPEIDAEPADGVNIAYEAEPRNAEDLPDATGMEE